MVRTAIIGSWSDNVTLAKIMGSKALTGCLAELFLTAGYCTRGPGSSLCLLRPDELLVVGLSIDYFERTLSSLTTRCISWENKVDHPILNPMKCAYTIYNNGTMGEPRCGNIKDSLVV